MRREIGDHLRAVFGDGTHVLLSMTGQGQGRRTLGSAEITSEVRAVNNRHLKIHTRTGDELSGLEPKIEALVRSHLRRGSLQLNVQLHGGASNSKFKLDMGVIESYLNQCHSLEEKLGLKESQIGVAEVLSLPGVVSDPRMTTEVEPDVEQAVLAAVTESLESLNRMRRAEGDSMAADLRKQLDRLRATTETIAQRAPGVIEDYKTRLQQKLTQALAEVDAELQESDLVREVLLMADKSDIREELVRLNSHFEQFGKMLLDDESQGRKLDFLIQEMFRETNTIGSKAGDAAIAQCVVDMKATIEQMRELVQNVE